MKCAWALWGGRQGMKGNKSPREPCTPAPSLLTHTSAVCMRQRPQGNSKPSVQLQCHLSKYIMKHPSWKDSQINQPRKQVSPSKQSGFLEVAFSSCLHSRLSHASPRPTPQSSRSQPGQDTLACAPKPEDPLHFSAPWCSDALLESAQRLQLSSSLLRLRPFYLTSQCCSPDHHFIILLAPLSWSTA